jgi:GNAT superfamily N-acetyltransferase
MSKPPSPEVQVDLALAQRLERAQGAQNRAATSPGGVLEVAGGLALFNGPGSPLTQALALGLDGPVDAEALARVEAHLGQGGGPVQVELGAFAHPTLAQLLGERGYRVAEFQQVFVRALGREAQPELGQEDEVRVLRPEERHAWARAVASAFMGREELSDEEASLMLPTTDMPGTTCFIARVRGELAGGGTVALHEGVATLSGTGVREAYRGRGLQAALIRARLAFAAEHGCTLASSSTLAATASQRNMERLGFRVAYPKLLMVRGLS